MHSNVPNKSGVEEIGKGLSDEVFNRSRSPVTFHVLANCVSALAAMALPKLKGLDSKLSKACEGVGP